MAAPDCLSSRWAYRLRGCKGFGKCTEGIIVFQDLPAETLLRLLLPLNDQV